MELWDIYNANHHKTGKIIKKGSDMSLNEFHLVVHLCLFNNDGKMLCQKRSITKSSFPFYWDLTVGGSALSGEDNKQALIREAFEELGIDISEEIGEVAYCLKSPFTLDDYFFIKKDIDLTTCKLQTSEVIKVAYFSLEEIDEMLKENRFADYFDFDLIKQQYEILFNLKKEEQDINL